jgi:hypothetical protein
MTRRIEVVENPDHPVEPAGAVRVASGESAEVIFERVCDKIGIRWERIPETATRTADYWIHLSDGTKVLIEVKQITPNEEEREHQGRFDRGEVAGIATAPGERVRSVIGYAIPQLKAAQAHGCPGIVVVHNAVFLQDHTDSHHIRCALYGDHVVELAVRRDTLGARARYIGPAFGKGRKARPDANTRLSALAVLQNFTDGENVSVYLVIYHNRYAAALARRMASEPLAEVHRDLV